MSTSIDFVNLFATHQASLLGNDVAWFNQYRQQALECVKQQGLPTSRHENWKYTDVAPILQHAFELTVPNKNISKQSIQAYQLDPNYHQLVFVNGRYDAALSQMRDLPANVVVSNLADALSKFPEDIKQYCEKNTNFTSSNFYALNTAFMSDGIFIKLPQNLVLDKPLHLLYLVDNEQETMQHTRNIIVAGSHSQATIIEHYVSATETAYFTTNMSDLVLQEHANIEHYKLQQEGKKAYHIGQVNAHQAHKSSLNCYTIDLGGKLVRNDINTILDAEECACTMFGLYMTKDRQHVDNHTTVNHAKPNSKSYEYYKGIMNDRSRAVFNGKVIVEQDAQKTSAHQSNKNLLLSKKAEIDTKPELEIYADDVRCTHGATVGQLDDTALFYLQSRGIDLEVARAALIYGFAKDIVSQFQLNSIRDKIDSLVIAQLPNGDKIKELA